jgi:hypothetical protein
MLPRFIDEVFLHPGERDPVFQAATKAFAIQGVLDYTALVIFHVDKLGKDIAEQLSISTPFLPWGLTLPLCKICSTAMWMCCKGRKGPKPHELQAAICCLSCNRTGIAYRPTDAKVLQQIFLDDRLYMRLTYPPSRRIEWESQGGGEVPGGRIGIKSKEKVSFFI